MPVIGFFGLLSFLFYGEYCSFFRTFFYFPKLTSTVFQGKFRRPLAVDVMVEVSVRNIVVDVTLRKIPSLFVPKPNGRNQPSSRPKGLALTDRA